MRIQFKNTLLLVVALVLGACSKEEAEAPVVLPVRFVEQVTIAGKTVANNGSVSGIPLEEVTIKIRFSGAVDLSKYATNRLFISGGVNNDFDIEAGESSSEVVLRLHNALKSLSSYKLYVVEGEHLGANFKDGYSYTFNTILDPSQKFPTLTDDELLTKIQQQTYKYFYDFAHPVSGLARERNTSGDIVTTGGSGFGFMATLVAIERGFISRQQGFEHLNKSVDFLAHKAERFHGAYSHWLNGSTGKAYAFSTKDNGADLIETAFLIEGLLAVKEYFKDGSASEQAMCDEIEQIWREVEWTWFQRGGQSTLYWHWSPNYGWDMNMQISGYNEGLIAYVLAAASPTYPIDPQVYHNGWARNGGIRNGKTFYGIVQPLGFDKGGPMFFAHYSFMGLDPRGLSDQYANYWEQNVAHTRINQAHCIANPRNYYGYSDECWGLTASDIKDGYTASEPNNDRSFIAPTAALASMPYLPEESMKAARFFYYTLGDRLFGEYGFYDSFSLDQRWFANSFLAIDQGPIVVMIENHRSGFVWDTFMKNTDVRNGLQRLGFSSSAK